MNESTPFIPAVHATAPLPVFDLSPPVGRHYQEWLRTAGWIFPFVWAVCVILGIIGVVTQEHALAPPFVICAFCAAYMAYYHPANEYCINFYSRSHSDYFNSCLTSAPVLQVSVSSSHNEMTGMTGTATGTGYNTSVVNLKAHNSNVVTHNASSPYPFSSWVDNSPELPSVEVPANGLLILKSWASLTLADAPTQSDYCEWKQRFLELNRRDSRVSLREQFILPPYVQRQGIMFGHVPYVGQTWYFISVVTGAQSYYGRWVEKHLNQAQVSFSKIIKTVPSVKESTLLVQQQQQLIAQQAAILAALGSQAA
jgi:hypothetical protein